MIFSIERAFWSLRENILRHEAGVQTGGLSAKNNRCSGFLPAQE